MKNQFKWMPMYWSDYNVETAHLGSAAEHGAYLLLIDYYWCLGEPIPDNDVILSRVTCQSMADWIEMKPTICGFFNYEDGFWRHSGLDEKREECRKASQRGRDSANARWHPERRNVVLQMPVKKE